MSSQKDLSAFEERENKLKELLIKILEHPLRESSKEQKDFIANELKGISSPIEDIIETLEDNQGELNSFFEEFSKQRDKNFQDVVNLLKAVKTQQGIGKEEDEKYFNLLKIQISNFEDKNGQYWAIQEKNNEILVNMYNFVREYESLFRDRIQSVISAIEDVARQRAKDKVDLQELLDAFYDKESISLNKIYRLQIYLLCGIICVTILVSTVMLKAFLF